MERRDARMKFLQADSLYQQGRYQEALDLLDALDEAFPGTRHIMFPRALCLFRLNRRQNAVALCDEIVVKFGYARARELKADIEAHQAKEQGHRLVGANREGRPQAVRGVRRSISRAAWLAIAVLATLAFVLGVLRYFWR